MLNGTYMSSICSEGFKIQEPIEMRAGKGAFDMCCLLLDPQFRSIQPYANAIEA